MGNERRSRSWLRLAEVVVWTRSTKPCACCSWRCAQKTYPKCGWATASRSTQSNIFETFGPLLGLRLESSQTTKAGPRCSRASVRGTSMSQKRQHRFCSDCAVLAKRFYHNIRFPFHTVLTHVRLRRHLQTIDYQDDSCRPNYQDVRFAALYLSNKALPTHATLPSARKNSNRSLHIMKVCIPFVQCSHDHVNS